MDYSDFISFLNRGYTSYHVARNIGIRLGEAGFSRLVDPEGWKKRDAPGYWIESGGAVIAFRTPPTDILPDKAIILASHTDGAHARHPAYRDRHDAGYAPRLGRGPVIKRSAIRRYASEIPGMDFGIPMIAMHSSRELMAPAGSRFYGTGDDLCPGREH